MARIGIETSRFVLIKMRLIKDDRVIKTSKCWLWTGTISATGYGRIGKRIDGKMKNFAVHRLVHEQEIGKIPKGHFVCHRCDIRNCVRPDHLFTGTAYDNNWDMMNKGRHRDRSKSQTHCKYGHALDKFRKKKTQRYCSECKRNSGEKRKDKAREYHRQWRLKRKNALTSSPESK